MRLYGKISSTPSNLKVVELRFFFLALFAEYTVKTVTHGKWQGDHYIQGGRYTQVKFAEKYKATENFGKLYGDSDIRGDRSYKAVYTSLTVSCLKVLRPSLFRAQP